MSTTTPSPQRRWRRVARHAAPIAGLLAAGLLVWQGSTAAFTASTDSSANAWTTGSLSLTNNGGSGTTYSGSTSTLFNETLIKPGSSGARCISVRSNGNLPGTLRLFRGATFTGTPNAATLAANLNVTIDAMSVVTTAPTVTAACAGYTGGTAGALFAGTLSSMPTTYATGAGTIAITGGNEYVTYRVGWSMPSSVTDNTLQSSNVIASLNWEVQ